VISESDIQDWIAKAEVFYGRFLNPARFGKPPNNHGSYMYAQDAKAWGKKTMEEKRRQAIQNILPPRRDPINEVYCANVAHEHTQFEHGLGRHRLGKETSPIKVTH